MFLSFVNFPEIILISFFKVKLIHCPSVLHPPTRIRRNLHIVNLTTHWVVLYLPMSTLVPIGLTEAPQTPTRNSVPFTFSKASYLFFPLKHYLLLIILWFSPLFFFCLNCTWQTCPQFESLPSQASHNHFIPFQCLALHLKTNKHFLFEEEITLFFFSCQLSEELSDWLQ